MLVRRIGSLACRLAILVFHRGRMLLVLRRRCGRFTHPLQRRTLPTSFPTWLLPRTIGLGVDALAFVHGIITGLPRVFIQRVLALLRVLRRFLRFRCLKAALRFPAVIRAVDRSGFPLVFPSRHSAVAFSGFCGLARRAGGLRIRPCGDQQKCNRGETRFHNHCCLHGGVVPFSILPAHQSSKTPVHIDSSKHHQQSQVATPKREKFMTVETSETIVAVETLVL